MSKTKTNSEQPPATRKSAFFSPLGIICAVIIVAVPLYWVLAQTPEFISLEKRYRASWPFFSSHTLLDGTWGEQAEEWMTDKMPARSFWVGLESYMNLLTGRQNAQDIIRDSNGNLLDAPPRYSQTELLRRLDRFIQLSDALDTEIFLIIPPTAGYTSKSALPEHIWRCYNDDILAEAVIAHMPADSFVDLRSEFLGADEALFYRTDHHWNSAGVYLAYTSLCAQMGLDPLPADDFIVSRNGGFYGSTYAKSGLWLTEADEIEMWAPPYDVHVYFGDSAVSAIGTGAETDGEIIVYDSLFFTEHLLERDQYSVFLDGIQGLTLIERLPSDAGLPSGRPEPPGSEMLLVIKDSYANSLIPLLVPHFRQIIMVDLRHYRLPVTELAQDIGLTERGGQVLAVYSADHIVNDSDIFWLR